MKLLVDKPERMVIEYRPVFLAAILIGMTLLLIYAAMSAFSDGDRGEALLILVVSLLLMGPGYWFGIERVQVILDRDSGTCTLRRRHFSGTTVSSYPLDEVTRAMLQTRKGDSEDPDSHRVALVLGADSPANRHGLTHSYRSGPQAERIVQRINTWLDSARATS